MTSLSPPPLHLLPPVLPGPPPSLRELSLLRGGERGLHNGRCGGSEVLSLQKGGSEQILAMQKRGGGGTASFEVVLTQELEP